MHNVLSHPYQLDESISNFRVVGWWYFSFLFIFLKRNFCKQTVENLIRRHVLSDLMLHCLPMSQKRTLGLYGLNMVVFHISLD